MYTIHASKTPERAAAMALNTALREVRGQDVLLLLSGGSALALADSIDDINLNEHVTVTVLDERYTYNEASSNFGSLMHMPFYKTAKQQKVHLLDTRPQQNESLKEAADRYNQALIDWHTKHPKGVVVATLGLGPDGHISGVLPYPEDPEFFTAHFEGNERVVVGYTATKEKNPHTKRMTTTLAYLRTYVAHAVLYIGDTAKQPALKAALAPTGDLAKTPARLLRDMKNVHIVVTSDMHTIGIT